MSDFQPPAWVRSWATTLVTSSVFVSFGVSVGGMLAVVAMMRGENPWPWFTAGSCIPPGIMALIYTTDSMFERRLRNLKRWKEEGIITAELYEEQVRQAMAWRASRLSRQHRQGHISPETEAQAESCRTSRVARAARCRADGSTCKLIVRNTL